MKKYSFLLVFSLLFIVSLFCPPYSKALDKPIVGAIRWDCWYGPARTPGADCDKVLSLPKWHYRAPFFGKFIPNGDGTYSVTFSALDLNSPQVENVTRQDMATAKNAGLDYWMFTMSVEGSYFNTLFEKYLAISQPDDINFAAETSGATQSGNFRGLFKQPPLNSSPQEIAAANALIAKSENFYFGPPSFTGTPSGIMKHVNYQKVLGGRPLLFMDFVDQTWINAWNNNYPGGIKGLMTKFRQDAINAGVGNPYIVLMDYRADKAMSKSAQMGNLDAISAYAITGGTTAGAPYSDLVKAELDLWTWQKDLRAQVVPVVQAGWDLRTILDYKPATYTNTAGADKYYVNLTPQQMAGNLSGAINWINTYPTSAQARLIIISAWNDNGEGGWIEPTIYEGDARLEEIAKVLKGSYFNTSRIKGVDLNSDRKIDFNDLQILINNFDKAIDPIPLNADINASGRVDIYDYNLLIQNYGR